MSRPERPAVLYVDDEEVNLKVFRANFDDQYRLLLASSGERALELLSAEEVAVVLSDERMPGMRGTELMTAVKERYPEVVRMVVTAYGDVNSVLEAVNSGEVWRYVMKPWRSESLAALIDGALEVYRLTRERNVLQVQLMLAERRAMLGLIAGSVGHELRNSLSASMSAQTVLQTLVTSFRALTDASLTVPVSPPVARLAEQVDLRQEMAELESWVAQLKDGLEHTSEIAHLLVDTVKSRELMELRPVDVSALVEAVARLARHQLLSLGARLRADIEPGLVASAEPLAVRQILLNLLVNAAQSVPEERRPSEVTLRCRRDRDRVLIEISDRGSGIRSEHLKQIFEPLFTTRGDDGTGLGLPISRELATRIGGELSVSSVLDEGSTFTLRLNAVAAPD